MARAILLSVIALGMVTGWSLRGSQSDVDAGTAVRLDIAGLVTEADIAFEGRVRSATVVRTPAGRIETEYDLDVERSFLGEPVAEQHVRLPGGVLPDGYGLILPGMPTLREGEDVILFLSEAGATGVRVPVGLSQGKFRVLTSWNGKRSLSRQHGSLTTIDPETGATRDASGAEVFDYADVIAEIHAAVATKESK